MTVSGLLVGDLLVGVVTTAAFIAAAAVIGRRRTLGLALLAAAVTGVVVRVATVILLWRVGWWFVEEKVLLTVPLLLVASAAAVLAVWRTRGPVAVVALTTAGLAGVAGFAVTLLGGYPVTVSVALLTVGLLVTGSVVTARLAGLDRLRAPAAAAFTLIVLGSGFALIAPSTVDIGGGPVSVTSLVGPSTPDPGGVVRKYTLQARTREVRLPSGQQITAWTFNDQFPGPALTATQGDLIDVTLTNVDITDGVTIHWHGYDVPNAEDGAPGLTQDAVLPGQSYEYRFRAEQVGTYWYHTHEVSDRGVKLGLFGSLVVLPRGATPSTTDLTVPLHTLGGTFVPGVCPDGLVADFVECGVPANSSLPVGSTVRLRLINTDDVPRLVDLVGASFRVVAVDGNDLNGPGVVDGVGLSVPAGGRYDVTFTMPAGPVGLRFPDYPAAVLPLNSTPPAAPSGWPTLDLLSYGTPAPSPYGLNSAFDRRFTLVLDRGLALVDGRPAYANTINGGAYPNVPTEVVHFGDLVEFTIVNRTTEVHPWHLHGHRVLILSRNGQPPSGSPLWMDTFDIRAGDVWRVAFRADNPGLWMNHCHNLAHADNGMAVHLAYDDVSSPFHGSHGG